MSKSHERINVEQAPHGKSSKAALTSSLVTFTPGGDFEIIRPDLRSLTRRGGLVARRSGVSTIEPPSTLHMNLAPALKRNLSLADFGRTTRPLLDRVAFMIDVLPKFRATFAFESTTSLRTG